MGHIWEGLLLLKTAITKRKTAVDYCWINYLANRVSFDRPAATKKGIILILFKPNPQLSALVIRALTFIFYFALTECSCISFIFSF